MHSPRFHDARSSCGVDSRCPRLYQAVPSGKRLHSYWKWPIEIVDLPTKNCGFPSFFLCLPEGIRLYQAYPIWISVPHRIQDPQSNEMSSRGACIAAVSWACDDCGERLTLLKTWEHGNMMEHVFMYFLGVSTQIVQAMATSWHLEFRSWWGELWYKPYNYVFFKTHQ